MVIQQGDLYWIASIDGDTTDIAIPHPYVILQSTLLNQTRLCTIVVCALTTNLKRASWPGNILLEQDEANLPKQSVIEVAKISSIEKSALGDYIGTLSEDRLQEIFDGIAFLQRTYQ